MNKPVSKVEWFDTYGYKFEFTGMQLAQLTYIPKLTDKGFEKFKVPEKIFKDVLDAYNVEKQSFKPEPQGVHLNMIDNYLPDKQSSYVTSNDYFLQWILEKMKQHHEDWCKFPLTGSQSYGFRKYVTGAYLYPHADRYKTHIISSIINVEQKVDEPWPLEIMGYDNKIHKTYLEPGEMLFYESAKLLHGRTSYLKGDYYVNLFLHYRPATWEVIEIHNEKDWIEFNKLNTGKNE